MPKAEPINHIALAGEGIDREFANESASTRRRFVQGAGAVIAAGGLLSVGAQDSIAAAGDNNLNNILNIAATAEVLATIVNTVGAEKFGSESDVSTPNKLDRVTTRNVRAAAQQELAHYNTLISLGGKELTKKIWVPDAVLENGTDGLLGGLVFGDQVFVNAYLLGVTVAARSGKSSQVSRYAAEFMGVEAVHRALALQSMGKLGNDRIYQAFEFKNVTTAVKLLQGAGFGFGVEGSKAGKFYDFDEVKGRTPTDPDVNTPEPR